MIRTVVLPFGRGGIVGGSMLGLGRALGETIAVALIISPIFEINLNWLHTGSNSVASLIALRFGEANADALSALMAAGLALFIVTLIVNMVASRIVSRSRSGSGSNYGAPLDIAQHASVVHPVVADESLPPQVRRVTPTTTRLEQALLAASGLSSFCLTWLLWSQLLPTQGAAGFLALWYASFLLLYFLSTILTEGRLPATDKIVTVIVMSGAVGLLVPLRAHHRLHCRAGIGGITATFFTRTLRRPAPWTPVEDWPRARGNARAVAIAVVISVPLGVLTAVFLNEVKGPLVRPVRIFVDAMSGVPSIVAGLFIYAVWIVQFGHGFSGFAAALALAVLMLPTITRTAEEVLRLVPAGLREASLALGAPGGARRCRSSCRPLAAALITAVILGVARAVGETAPLIMTSFGATVANVNPFDGAQASLPLSVYQLVSNPFASQQERCVRGCVRPHPHRPRALALASSLGRKRKPRTSQRKLTLFRRNK